MEELRKMLIKKYHLSIEEMDELFNRIEAIGRRTKLDIKSEKSNIRSFQSFSSRLHPQHLISFDIKHLHYSYELCCIIYLYVAQSGRSVHESQLLYFYGLIDLKQDYGTGFIKPETLEEKINEWFKPVEIDIPAYPKFSRKYYVFSDKKDLFIPFLKPNLLEYLESIEDVYLEVNGDKCLYYVSKPIFSMDVHQFCEIGQRLVEILK